MNRRTERSLTRWLGLALLANVAMGACEPEPTVLKSYARVIPVAASEIEIAPREDEESDPTPTSTSTATPEPTFTGTPTSTRRASCA